MRGLVADDISSFPFFHRQASLEKEIAVLTTIVQTHRERVDALERDSAELRHRCEAEKKRTTEVGVLPDPFTPVTLIEHPHAVNHAASGTRRRWRETANRDA